eukprot:5356164-Pyramimonas_sp.AAC.1
MGSGAGPTGGGAPPDLVAVGRVAGWAGVGSSPCGVGGKEGVRGESPPLMGGLVGDGQGLVAWTGLGVTRLSL